MNIHAAMTAEVALGRLFLGRFPQKADLLRSLEEFFLQQQIRAGFFSATGTALSATFGVYDPSQRVYALRVETTPLDIVSCAGSVLPGEAHPEIEAHVVLGNGQTALCGGRLFSETLVEDAEFEFREIVGSLPSRAYDPLTGRMHLHLS